MDISAACMAIHMRVDANNLVTTASTTRLPDCAINVQWTCHYVRNQQGHDGEGEKLMDWYSSFQSWNYNLECLTVLFQSSFLVNIRHEDLMVHRRVAIKQGGILTIGGAYLWDLALLLEGVTA